MGVAAYINRQIITATHCNLNQKRKEYCFLRLTKSQKVYRYDSEGGVDVGRDLLISAKKQS
jgi:hypothetical protein